MRELSSKIASEKDFVKLSGSGVAIQKVQNTMKQAFQSKLNNQNYKLLIKYLSE